MIAYQTTRVRIERIGDAIVNLDVQRNADETESDFNERVRVESEAAYQAAIVRGGIGTSP